jgi:hypothetical protein
MELTQEMKEFLDAVDEGYKRTNLEPANVTVAYIAERYLVCGAMAACIHKTGSIAKRFDMYELLPAVSQAFKIPQAFVEGFIRGFDCSHIWDFENSEEFRLGYEHGKEKREKHIPGQSCL